MAKNEMEAARFNMGEDASGDIIEKYKCANCGLINETSGGAPKNCVKCDNGKFYKL